MVVSPTGGESESFVSICFIARIGNCLSLFNLAASFRNSDQNLSNSAAAESSRGSDER